MVAAGDSETKPEAGPAVTSDGGSSGAADSVQTAPMATKPAAAVKKEEDGDGDAAHEPPAKKVRTEEAAAATTVAAATTAAAASPGATAQAQSHTALAQKQATIGSAGLHALSPSAGRNAVDPERQKLWVIMGRKDIPRAAKAHFTSRKVVLRNASMAAIACTKEIRKKALESKRTAKETTARAKKIMREMLQFWRKYEREERASVTRVRREPRPAGPPKETSAAQKRREAEAIEAKRQARKFDYLVSQTELYAHFLSNKIKKKKGGDTDGKQAEILDSIDQKSAGLPAADESAEQMKQRAIREAEAAVARQKRATSSFAASADAAAGKPVGSSTSAGQDAQGQFDDQFSLANPEMAGTEDIAQPALFKGQLKAYQLKGLNWLVGLWENGINGILADEMGLGKTVQTIVSLAHLAEEKGIWGPFLVVAPTSTLHNWEQEFRKFTPEFTVLPYWGTQQQRKILRRDWNPTLLSQKESPFHVVITSYQMVVTDDKHFQRLHWQYMINDEAQALKSSSSVRWNTLLQFKCRNRLLLTGTPIQNSMQELWSLLHFIMPSLFDSHSEFNEWFSKDIEKKAANKAAALDNEQLGRLHMILAPFMLRRIKKDVQHELADKIEVQIDCSLSTRQRTIYDAIMRKISINALIGASSSASADKTAHGELMNLVMQFRKVCNHPHLFKRRDVQCPFIFESERWNPPTNREQAPAAPKDTSVPYVRYLCSNPIVYQLPRLLFREIVVRQNDHGSLDHVNWLCSGKQFGVLTPEHIHRSLFPSNDDSATLVHSGSLYSPLRFADTSASFVSEAARSTPVELWLLQVLIAKHAESVGAISPFAGDSDDPAAAKHYPPMHRMALLSGNVGTGTNMISLHTGFASIASEHPYFNRMHLLSASVSRAIAPPILPVVLGDRAAAYAFETEARHIVRGGAGLSMLLPDGLPELRSSGDGLVGQLAPSIPPRGLLSAIDGANAPTDFLHPKAGMLLTDCDKMQRLDKLLVELKREGHRVLIYSQMTKMLDLLEEYMAYRRYGYIRLDGSSKIGDRRDMVADFQNRDDIFVFLLSTRAGGLGINLTAADTVIFYDSDWNPTVDQQAMDRAHRVGQTKQVTVYRMVTTNTVEERILQRAKQKSEIQKMVMSGQKDKKALGELKSSEVVSLLLDTEISAQVAQQKAKLEKKEAEKKRPAGAPAAGAVKKAKANDGAAISPEAAPAAALVPAERDA